MPNPAVGATAGPGMPQQTGGGGGIGANPFQIATNLYAEKNLQGAQTGILLTGSQIASGGSVNAGQYLRALRLMVRTTVAAVGGTVVGDAPFSVFGQLDLTNVDGSEILYNMGGYAYYLGEKYFRPWLCDPGRRYDFQAASATSGGSFTVSLQPEIRFTAGVLANTDTRSQYRFDYTLNGTGLYSAITTYPTMAVIPYMDAWAQPDAQDLQGTPNQPVPPGVNLQLKRRHQIFTLNANGSDNILLSTLTGNAIRGMLLVTRTAAANNPRVDGFSDPFYWQLDNRSLGRLNPDIIRQWAEDFYSDLNLSGSSSANTVGNPSTTSNNAVGGLSGTGLYAANGAEDQGVYVFPRWIEPGELYGQGWLYTANSTKLQFESVTQNSAATCELITDEVYPVGQVDPALVDI
jgi:hypothetical protein